MNGCHSAEITIFVFIRVNWGQTKKGSQFSYLNENPSLSLHFVFECTNTIVQENVKLQREFGGRLGKEYIMDTFSHPRLSMKLLLSRFLAVEEIYWGKSFASWIFYQGASQDFFSWVFKPYERWKKKTRFSVRNMPWRKSKFTSESSWEGLDCLRSWADTFSITATKGGQMDFIHFRY